ncbi:MAG: hypothetical protein ABWJ98_02630 [Hydrogenothermaceae bacterium]
MKFIFLLGLIIISQAFGFSNKADDYPVTEPEVKFYALKSEYHKGEEVCFILENISSKQIYLPSAGSWAVFLKEKPEIAVYSPLSAQVITTVKPSEKKKWCWNQKDIEGKDVPSGEYYIRITLFDDKGSLIFKRAVLRINF